MKTRLNYNKLPLSAVLPGLTPMLPKWKFQSTTLAGFASWRRQKMRRWSRVQTTQHDSKIITSRAYRVNTPCLTGLGPRSNRGRDWSQETWVIVTTKLLIRKRWSLIAMTMKMVQRTRLVISWNLTLQFLAEVKSCSRMAFSRTANWGTPMLPVSTRVLLAQWVSIRPRIYS